MPIFIRDIILGILKKLNSIFGYWKITIDHVNGIFIMLPTKVYFVDRK